VRPYECPPTTARIIRS